MAVKGMITDGDSVSRAVYLSLEAQDHLNAIKNEAMNNNGQMYAPYMLEKLRGLRSCVDSLTSMAQEAME